MCVRHFRVRIDVWTVTLKRVSHTCTHTYMFLTPQLLLQLVANLIVTNDSIDTNTLGSGDSRTNRSIHFS